MAAESIIIDFILNEESLQPALDKLTQLGVIDQKVANSFKQTTAELNKQISTVNKVATATAPVKKNLEDVAKATKSVANEFMIGFQEGVIDTLKEAGVSIEQFEQAMGDTGGKTKVATQTVRAELRELIEVIARAKAENRDYGEQYDALVLKAGKLKDAIGDVNLEIKNAGSDTRTFDNVLGAATAVAGGFAAAQGAVALFGDESEELQEVLVKVNAAMAIAQGLQVVTNALQKEGAVTLLAMNVQRRISAATLVVENALQSQSVIVRGAATIAQKALNLAMSLNPVGLLVAGLVTLILTIKSFTSSAETATESLKKLNAEFERDVNGLQDYAETVKRNGDELLASMEARGAKSSELNRQTTQNLQEELRATIETESQYRDQYRQSIALLTDVANGRRKLNKEEVEQAETLVAGFEALSKRRIDLASQVRVQIVKNEKTIVDEQKEAAEKAKQDSEKAAAERRAAQELILRDQIAAIERQLLAVDQGSNAELTLQKRLIVAKSNLELNAEKITANEKKLIFEQSLVDREKLQKDFDARIRNESIGAQISLNNAQLSLLKTNDDERLLLQLSNIGFAAQLELDAAVGNAAKIKEIITRRDAEIRDTKKRFIDEAVEYEISLASASGGSTRRALERIVSDEKAKKDLRIRSANELLELDLRDIDKRIEALNKENSLRLISDKDYALKHAQLVDQRKAKEGKTEEDITKIFETEAEKRKRITRETIDIIIDSGRQVVDIFNSLAQLQADRENQRLETERNRVKDQLEAGQITEKEAIARNKRLDAEERRVKLAQAQRDKRIAIFNAIISTAAAVAKAAPVVPLMIFAAAAGAAQIAIIASQPLPRFAKGKKKGETYTGWGEIGETGPELMERDGRLYLAPKRTIVHIKSQDIIHNPKETKSIFERFNQSKSDISTSSDKSTHSEKVVEKAMQLERNIQNNTRSFFSKILSNNNNLSTSNSTTTHSSTSVKESLERALQMNSTAFFEKVINSNKYLESVTHKVDKQVMNYKESVKQIPIDYDQLGKAIAKHSKGTSISIDKDFIKESIADGLSINNHHSKYYKSP